MLYKKFKDIYISRLGLGCMRLPVKNGNNSEIDVARTEEMVDYAIAHGVNYFDTAWPYHGGHSEEVVGTILRNYPREDHFICDKFPGYELSNMGKVKEIFSEQLRRTGQDYFDFYLFHNVCENNVNQYLDPKNGILEYLLEQKKEGRIRHLGFSAHGNMPVLKQFMDAYGEHMEMAQIQLNYLDWSFQNAQEKMEYLSGCGLGIWVMEGMRGGRLARLAPEEEAALKALRPDESVPAWALRFLQSLPEVNVVLTGASDPEQLKQNIAVMEKDVPLDLNETVTLLNIAEGMVKNTSVPCTACNYCVSHCPQELNIPALLAQYNEQVFTPDGFIPDRYVESLPENKRPGACLGCRSCEQVCPQGIKISEALADFVERLK